MYCSLVIYKCAEDEGTREAVRVAGGLEPLVLGAATIQPFESKEENSDQEGPEERELLSALTGALWKCSAGAAGARCLDSLAAVDVLVQLLKYPCDRVLTNVVGALAECAKCVANRDKLRAAEGIPLLS